MLLGLAGFFIGSLLMILVAVFVYMGAGTELEGSLIRYYLKDVPVRNVMTKEVETVAPDLNLVELLEKMLEQGHLGYLVCQNNKTLGIVTLEDVRNVPAPKRVTTRVKDIMQTDLVAVPPDEDASQVMLLMKKHDIGRILVIDPNQPHQCAGIITRSDIIQYVQVVRVIRGKEEQEVRSVPT